MAKAILDIYFEKAFPYEFNLNMNTPAGEDLENDYNCYFECAPITAGVGNSRLQFSVVNNRYHLDISGVNTDKITSSLEEYIVYIVEIATGKEEKLLSGRVHIDHKVRK
jgi:hypothetical protein